MEEKFKRTWLRRIVIIYILVASFQFIAAFVTAYALGHPELGLSELIESTRSNIANFGLVLGILITVLQGLFWVLMPCLVLVIYWYCDRKNKKLTHRDLFVYSGIFAFGMSILAIWFVDAVNDVLWLFFHGSPAWLSLFLGSLPVVLPLLFVVFFLLSLTIYYLILRKWHRARLV